MNPMGTKALRSWRTTLAGTPRSCARRLIAIGVSINPGNMALARMPCAACSMAMCWVKALTPAFEVLYVTVGRAAKEEVEEMLMMQPDC